MSQLADLAQRFLTRFAGLDRAHGRYVLNGQQDARGKEQGDARTFRTPPTRELWEEHLAGNYHLGIVPIRDDASVSWAAIDIDAKNYNEFNFGKIADDVFRMNLPLIVCRSKSGGAHLYLFLRAPASAELVRNKMMEMAESLGYSGVEVFPKQVRLSGPNDTGNWINMPYFEAAKTKRYAIHDGKPLSAAAFLDLADLLAIAPDDLATLNIADDPKFAEVLKGAPPCLRCLASRGGVPEGMRNDGLFNYGVYLRKRFGDNFGEMLDEYNQMFISPPLGHKEVATVAKSVGKTKYQYKCTQEPIRSVCSRQICLTREFGVGSDDDDPGVVYGPLVKINTDPPIWIWDVDGARVELSTEQMKDQGRAHTRIIEVLNKWPNMVKPKVWSTIIRDRLASLEVQEAPPESSTDTLVMSLLEQMCTGRVQARDKDDLVDNKPWTNEGRTYFSGEWFRQELLRHRIDIKANRLWIILRNHGAQHHFFNLKGRGKNVWSVPSFRQQSEDFSIPRLASISHDPDDSAPM